MTTMTRKPGKAKAVIQVRVDARMKSRAEKIFRKQGLSTSDGVRRLLQRAIEETDPWYAHNTSSHVPNAELRKVIEEAREGVNMESVTIDELQKIWDEA